MCHALVIFGVLLPASLCDIRSYRIHNLLIFSGFLLSLFYAVSMHGVAGIVSWLLRAIGSCVLFYPFYFSGAFGASDVKLISVIGSFYGIFFGLSVMIYAILVGGVLSLVTLCYHGTLKTTIQTTIQTIKSGIFDVVNHQSISIDIPKPKMKDGEVIPFAVCISVGTFLAMM